MTAIIMQWRAENINSFWIIITNLGNKNRSRIVIASVMKRSQGAHFI